ncbi:MAG: GAF domain-containing protein [Gammaproteobacteria bacterium]|nr:GAF domain-containing protein [Gammaproteobacteria bacterium]
MLHSLKFQITAVLVILLSLFSFATAYTLYNINEREKEMAALHLVNRLQLITTYMDVQSLNYLKNAPKNSSAYQRDINLYYDDIKNQLDSKNDIINCFADEHLTAELVDMSSGIDLNLDMGTKKTLSRLQQAWNTYYEDLNETLGKRNEHPKLAAAAQYITDNQSNIEAIEETVVKQLQHDLKKRIHWISFVSKLVLFISIIIALITLIGFYIKVIIPLNNAVEGFNRVAKGDFGHQVVISSDNEIASIAKSFNHLSQRLNSIFKLIHRVQQGDDLDSTLGFIAEQFSSILPISWTSVLLHNGNATMLELQKAYKDGKPHFLPRTHFSIESTLLEKAMKSDKPLLIANVPEVAAKNEHYVFLRLLAKEGMQSAIFLHLTETTQVPGMLIFASREANAYNEEHIELLSNIAHLVTHSFGKTVKMAEQKQLAAIGEFTSGIVHEVRNPLTTIGLALKYFSRLELDEDGSEWADISNRESERMGRLLEDILLYAKPVKLELQSIDFLSFVLDFIHGNKAMGEAKGIELKIPQFEHEYQITVKADTDRLSQILLNIYRNAVEAASNKSCIQCTLSMDTDAHTATLVINNQGDVIPEGVLKRIGEPFFTTKNRGTGLGMGIVKRMVDAHSGQLKITSNLEEGTSVSLTFPVFI